MLANWLDSYYESLEFLYWEPQHIGRKKNVAAEFSTHKKVVKHLRQMEVTLNHNINQFFLLAPAAIRCRLFHDLFGRDFEALFKMHGRDTDADFSLVSAMQPDFLFVSSTDVVSIEMKVGAKSSIQQALKYALLSLAVELHDESTKSHCLAFLGARDFAHQWKEAFASPAELRRALDAADLAAFLQSRPVRFRKHQDRFNSIVKRLELAFLSYEQFAEILRSEAPSPTDTSSGAEVYRNLISGLLSEFERRQLTLT